MPARRRGRRPRASANGCHRVPEDPDGHYFVVRGRLWRLSNPHLADSEREVAVKKLMDARRDLRGHAAAADAADARRRVDETAAARAHGIEHAILEISTSGVRGRQVATN